MYITKDRCNHISDSLEDSSIETNTAECPDDCDDLDYSEIDAVDMDNDGTEDDDIDWIIGGYVNLALPQGET